jgi:membrane protein YdbS with pleckstrin-like domain
MRASDGRAVGYVDSRLAPDEEVVARTRLHPVVFAGAAWFAAFVAGVTTLIVVRNALPREVVAQLWLAAAAAVAAGFVPPLLRRRSSEFAVTTQRLLVRLGVLPRTLELPLSEVERAEVHQTLGGRLLGYGTLHVAGRGDRLESFPRLAEPERLRQAMLRRGGRAAAGSGR